MAAGITGAAGTLLDALHNGINDLLGLGGGSAPAAPTAVIRPISLAQAEVLVKEGFTMAQLTTLGYVIVS